MGELALLLFLILLFQHYYNCKCISELFFDNAGLEGYKEEDSLCDVYFNGTRPCQGGVLALEGQTGRELWRHYTNHEVFAMNCGYDIDRDGVKDCLVGGRVAVSAVYI